ncbi:PREDICTED: uncharacterized protein LOC104606511 [Nelumbo nucifera]|uniref:Uncharacterized protein LOC104606511 n=2 Tax=Nelumbo nucifera TaxID=4432 RepID=A0A1U8B260_NELNU|nr:PREDICTED: uncharacterized protein LOC104606511 [Nelumbo nucifera]DAD20363.1 TPA_asm: hypothetical protein HUJ06_021826 [Nelumbo nucifera]
MHRLRSYGTSIFGPLAMPRLRRKALNSWSAVQDTYFSTKDIFERHRVVFTISTSLASIATAWVGYSLRYLHQAKVEERLESIEKAMKKNYHIEHAEIKKIVGSGSISTTTCIATAGTSLIIGYGLGWRGGKWYANRKFRREQMKLLGQIKPKRWQFQFLRRPYSKTRLTESSTRNSEAMHNGFTTTLGSRQAPQSC